MIRTVLFLLLFTMFMTCKQNQEVSEPETGILDIQEPTGMQIVNLEEGNPNRLKAIQSAFKKNNPGYHLDYYSEVSVIEKSDNNQVLFIQKGGGAASISSGIDSKFSIGDIILLDKGVKLTSDSLFSTLTFQVPEDFPKNIPRFIRPDWDPNITDTPGGCATETNAYRRILLTWLNKVGPYQYHALNAHRVRIMDSFTHYHPLVGGFDEFYLVQMVMPDAQIITSNQLAAIQDPVKLKRLQLKGLLQSTKLKVGDLVYLPRGVIHRGINGVLAQVITVPGFVPNSEIGVDHLIKSINDQFGLKGEDLLPYNVSASEKPIVK